MVIFTICHDLWFSFQFRFESLVYILVIYVSVHQVVLSPPDISETCSCPCCCFSSAKYHILVFAPPVTFLSILGSFTFVCFLRAYSTYIVM